MSFEGRIVDFARLLRAAGLPVSAGDTLTAWRALGYVDPAVGGELEAALRCVFCRGTGDFAVFDAAFAAFWGTGSGTVLPAAPAADGSAAAGARRVAEAMAAESRPGVTVARCRWEGASGAETLRHMDFEAMGADELAAAQRAAARLSMPNDRIRIRRRRPDPGGDTIDLHATWKRILRDGGEVADLARSRRRTVQPPLVVLCDISGSMRHYAPMLLRFVHALSLRRRHVQLFLFGTRLTNVTRALSARDPEVALQAIGAAVPDWSGGTRIAGMLRAFNYRWARRVLAQGTTVLLLTDGLDRPDGTGEGADLGEEMARLHRSCRTLIWLNPLLRFSGFAPRAASIAAMLPHVDIFRSAHNLASLDAVAGLMSAAGRRKRVLF